MQQFKHIEVKKKLSGRSISPKVRTGQIKKRPLKPLKK